MDYTRFDPAKLGERSQVAYRALYQQGDLSDGGNIWDRDWHDWAVVLSRMLEASDLTAKSCSDIIRGLEYNGEILRRGRWSARRDRRQLRFIDVDPTLDLSDQDPDELKLKEQAMEEARQRRR